MRNKAIVIGTYHGRGAWVADCLNSLDGEDYNIIVVNALYEIGAIKWVYDHTDIDEFIFLQDTVIAKSWIWIDKCFDFPGSVSLCSKPYFMYLGKYCRNVLDKVPFPTVLNKRDAVTHEGDWTSQYVRAAGGIVHSLWDLDDSQTYEDRHGRMNMVIENEHIKKYKGTWHPDMIGST